MKNDARFVGISIGLAAMASVLSGCDGISIHMDHMGPSIKGAGDVKSEPRAVGSFDKVAVGGGFLVDVKVGPKESVTIEAQPNLLKAIKTSVKDGELRIETTGSITTDKKLAVHITVPSLSAIDVSGGVQATVDGISGKSLDADASGGSRIDINGTADNVVLNASGGAQASMGAIRAKTLELEASGGASITLNGTAEKAKVSANGGAHVDLASTVLRDADADGSGAAQIELNVTGMLNARANGASRISYKGHPKVSAEANGASSVQSSD